MTNKPENVSSEARPVCQRFSDDEILAWANRHDLRVSSATERRCIFEDAHSLAAAPPVAQPDRDVMQQALEALQADLPNYGDRGARDCDVTEKLQRVGKIIIALRARLASPADGYQHDSHSPEHLAAVLGIASPVAQPVTCQIYGHVVGHCSECNVGADDAADSVNETNKVLADNYLKCTAQPVEPVAWMVEIVRNRVCPAVRELTFDEPTAFYNREDSTVTPLAPITPPSMQAPIKQEQIPDYSSRYRVESNGLSYEVKCGTGTRSLYVTKFGKRDAELVAMELQTAFNDGLYAGLQAPIKQSEEPIAYWCEYAGHEDVMKIDLLFSRPDENSGYDAIRPLGFTDLRLQAPKEQDGDALADKRVAQPTVFMDEIDAARAGDAWLKTKFTPQCRMARINDNGGQMPRVKWVALFDTYDRLTHAFLLTRDAKNWTQLTLVDVVRAALQQPGKEPK